MMQSMRIPSSIRVSRRSQKPKQLRSITTTASSRNSRFLRPRHDDSDHERHGNTTLRMLMFGKPGAGKGTLTARLVQQYDILSLSTGDLLRHHIADRTEVGLQAEEIVARGRLLPDELMLRVVTSKLKALSNKHWILDGFPRTLGQGEMLDAYLQKQGTPLTFVASLDVPDEVILSRISDRYVHLKSGRIYNISFNPPKVEGLDDETGEPLTKRPDDNPEIFAHRLEQFYASTQPLLEYYSTSATSPSSESMPFTRRQHPHQLAFPQRPLSQKLVLESLSGRTSAEIWPKLEHVVTKNFPNLREKSEFVEARRRHSVSEALQSQGSLASIRGSAVLGGK